MEYVVLCCSCRRPRFRDKDDAHRHGNRNMAPIRSTEVVDAEGASMLFQSYGDNKVGFHSKKVFRSIGSTAGCQFSLR